MKIDRLIDEPYLNESEFLQYCNDFRKLGLIRYLIKTIKGYEVPSDTTTTALFKELSPITNLLEKEILYLVLWSAIPKENEKYVMEKSEFRKLPLKDKLIYLFENELALNYMKNRDLLTLLKILNKIWHETT